MKTLAIGLALLLPVSTAPKLASAQARARDEAAIRAIVAAHASASAKRDLRGLVDVYHADAVVRYSSGTTLRGRAAIEKDYAESLAAAPADSGHAHPVETLRIRFLRPDVAFVDVASVSGSTSTPLFVVFTKENGRWGVAEQRSGVSRSSGSDSFDRL